MDEESTRGCRLLHLETFPPVPVIQDVVKTIEPMATKNGNHLVIDCPADLGTIHADETRFRQSLLNLASNANKFTDKGTITIAAHQGIKLPRSPVSLSSGYEVSSSPFLAGQAASICGAFRWEDRL